MRVAAPRRFLQVVRAEQSPIDQAEQAVKEVEQTVSQVMILFGGLCEVSIWHSKSSIIKCFKMLLSREVRGAMI